MANYEWNKEYIAKALCENRDKPQMHCNGKCHLKKQLEKAEKKENAPVSSKDKNEIQLFSEGKFKLELSGPAEKSSYNSAYLFSVSESPLASIFHPPSVS